MFDIELVRKIIFFCVTCLVAAILTRITGKAIRHIFEKSNVPRGSIVINLTRVLIWSVALMVVLEPVFGIQPTAFIAALGVTSVALSLGLQNTIGNVIGGLSLMLAHIIEVGDWIEVGSYQGEVTDITWRSTTIKTILGDVVVIPNSVLDATMLRKMSPISSHTITIPLDIHPEADMTEVEQDILAAVTEAVAEWRDPLYDIALIEMGYGSFGFRLEVRVPLRNMNDALAARSATVRACSGRSWLARW
ncbi:MAG: mechanosensitive ion channel [Coriobacteriales bacterium]|nr:mechanosensitive ion channel [Coriobacteriales bacterium]